MLTFYHAPYSRSGPTHWLLEELGVPYTTEIVDIRAKGGAPEGYRAIQPNKKVPAIVHDGVTITERAAIFTYLCDAFPAAGLAPPVGDPRRGPYLSWLVYCDSVLDPVFTAKMNGWTYENIGVSYGSYEDALRHIREVLTASPFLTGDTFTAADIAFAGVLNWLIHVAKLIPMEEPFAGYLGRTVTREASVRASAKDAA